MDSFVYGRGLGSQGSRRTVYRQRADVNAMDGGGKTPLDEATHPDNPNASAEIADLLRKHGGKTGEELKFKVK